MAVPPTTTRRSQAERRKKTSDAMLSAARRAFAEHGFADAPAEAIVLDSGVTRGALYHHFGSKKGLFEAVLARVMGEAAERIEQAAASETGTWNQFRAGCRAFLAASIDPDFQRIALVDGPAVLGWQAWRKLDAETSVRSLRAGLDELSREGLLVPAPLEALTQLLSGAMNELALWVAQSADREQAMREAESALETVLAGLRNR